MTEGHGEKLSRKQELAIEALLSEATIVAAAAKAGLGEKTLRRWIQRRSFADAYRIAREKAFANALANLRAASQDAVETLRIALSHPSGPLRVRAATAILELGSRSQVVDLAQQSTSQEAEQERLEEQRKLFNLLTIDEKRT